MSDTTREVFVAALREALSQAVTTSDGDRIRFEEGPIEGPQSDRDIGCVWFEGVRPHGRDGNIAENYYRVRVFRRWVQDQGGEEPRTTLHAHLLRLQDELEAALRANLICEGHDYFIVREVTPDYVRQSIDAQVTAFDRNPTAAGG